MFKYEIQFFDSTAGAPNFKEGNLALMINVNINEKIY